MVIEFNILGYVFKPDNALVVQFKFLDRAQVRNVEDRRLRNMLPAMARVVQGR